MLVFASRNLARNVLLRMAVRVALVIIVATGITYWHSYRAYQNDSLSFLSKYVAARGDAESDLFLQAEYNSRRMRDEFIRRLNARLGQDPDVEFASLIAQEGDGIYRVRPERSDFAHKATVAILSTANFTPQFKQEVLVAYQIASEYGPAYRDRYYDTFFPLHGNDVVVMYLPDTDYSRTGSSDMLLVDYASEVGSSPENNPSRKTYWTDVYFDEVVRKWMVSVATPIDFNGQWIGGVGHDVPVQQLIDRSINVHIPGTYNLILTRGGHLLAHPELSQAIARAGGVFDVNRYKDPALKQIYQAALTADGDHNVVETADGKLLLGVSEIQGPDWMFVTVYPKTLLAERAESSARVLLILGVLSLILEIALLGWVLRRHVSRPLQQFLNAIAALRHGSDATPLPAGRQDEIGEISRAFEDMASTVNNHRLTLESQVQERTSQLLALFDANPLPTLKVIDGRITAANRAALLVLGYSEAQLRDSTLRQLFITQHAYDAVCEAALPFLEDGGVFNQELRLVTAAGRSFWANLYAKAIQPENPRKAGVLWIFEDISERREVEEKIRHMAQHDQLTGLANRALLYERLNQLLLVAHRQQKSLAVLFVDLDDFKPVNDHYGHDMGDKVLQQVAQRLNDCVRETDVVARVGGDEFIVILFDLHGETDARAVAGNLVRKIAAPISLGEARIQLAGSIGITLYPQDGNSADTLINKADVAMYRAKELGKNRFAFFGDTLGASPAEDNRRENSSTGGKPPAQDPKKTPDGR